MTTDLVTYYGQTPIIDQLVNKYGVYLEKLDREDKLLLRMALANYVFMQEDSNPDKYTFRRQKAGGRRLLWNPRLKTRD